MTTDKSIPEPELSELDEHFFEALREGRLIYQRSGESAWLPPRTEDPVSLSTQWDWDEASGRARLVSWVTYHIAYHPYFEDKLPYKVGVIELEEGPRLIAPVDAASATLTIDCEMTLDIREEDGWALPYFMPTSRVVGVGAQ